VCGGGGGGGSGSASYRRVLSTSSSIAATREMDALLVEQKAEGRWLMADGRWPSVRWIGRLSSSQPSRAFLPSICWMGMI